MPFAYVNIFDSISYIDVIKGNSLGFTTNCPIGLKNLVYGDKGIKVRYRPINVASPFNDKRKNQIEKTAQNWASWYCGDDDSCSSSNINKKRISGSYSLYPSSPLYRVVLNDSTMEYIGEIDTHYSSFVGINADGSSNLVRNNNIFVINRATNGSERSFCGLGIYDSSGGCDKYRIG